MGGGVSTFSQIVVYILLGMAVLSVGLFALDRFAGPSNSDQPRGVRALFANPFLKVAAILLLVLILVGDFNSRLSLGNGFESDLAWLVVGAIAATVAGADFVLLFTAILFRKDLFIREFFQTERAKLDQAKRAQTHARGAARKLASFDNKDVHEPSVEEIEAHLERMPSRLQVLWVDDQPRNNIDEIMMLREMGLGVDVRQNNQEAVNAFRQGRYDLVISDIGRDPPEDGDAWAGLRLPAALETAYPDMSLPPFIYYVHQVDAPMTDMGHPVVRTPTELLDQIEIALRDGS